MICCSNDCNKCSKCGKYICNLSLKYRNGYHTVEHLASFGGGSISKNGCEIYYVCGPNGDYAMYEPININEVIK